MRELTLQNQILDHLNRHYGYFFTVRTTGTYDQDKGFYRRLGGYSIKGISDILGVFKGGRIGAIEVKIGRNTPSRHQMNFLNQINKRGGFAIWVNSYEDFFNQIKGAKNEQGV